MVSGPTCILDDLSDLNENWPSIAIFLLFRTALQHLEFKEGEMGRG